MAGLSSKAFGRVDNKRKWNAGSELNTDFGIHLYETHFRSLDPQIGSEVISDTLHHYGKPSNPNPGGSGDYGPYLYRSATAAQRGQSLIASHYGFTVYGTAASAKPGIGNSNLTVTEAVVPKPESYYLYKQLKK